MYYYKKEIDGEVFCFATEEVVYYDGVTQVTKEEYDSYTEKQKAIAEALKNKRYYYKKENAYFNLKYPMTGEGIEEISKEKFIAEAF